MKSIIVRAAQADDVGSIRTIQNGLVNDIAVDVSAQYSDDMQLRNLIEATLRDFPFLLACEGVHVSGFAYARAHRAAGAFRWSVDVVVQIAKSTSLNAVDSLYRQLLRDLRAQGYLTAYALVSPSSGFSVALHQALGFSRLGPHAAIDFEQDLDCWSVALCEENPRSEPISFEALRQIKARSS